MNFKTGLFFLFLLMSFCGFSQKVHVKGKIIDKEKKAYPGLRIILDSQGGDSISTYTNKKGNVYFFCYDLGYMPLDDDWYLLVKRKEVSTPSPR